MLINFYIWVRKFLLVSFIVYLSSITITVMLNILDFNLFERKIVSINRRVIGVDFIALYTGGKLARMDKKNLYDLEVQRKNRPKIYLINTDDSLKGELPFVYPPLVAWFFSFFTNFEFYKAFYLWTLLSIFISISSLFGVSYYIGILTKKSFFLIILSIFGFLPYSVHCLANGQVSTLGIMVYSLIYILLKEKQDFMAGFVLSLGYYKPPIFLFFSIVFIFNRGRQFFYGCFSGATILLILSVFYVGIGGFRKYLIVASKYTYGQKLFEGVMLPPEFGVGIFGLIASIFSSLIGNLVVISIIFISLVCICNKIINGYNNDEDKFDWIYSFIVIASLSLSLQFNGYDLSILLPVFILLYSKISYIKKEDLSVFILMVLFYFEWMFRLISIFGKVVNLSSFLFILLLIALYKKIQIKDCYSKILF